ncbi:MAG: transcriptional regulator [Phototrophicales bacterium]|nr:MAG: transcriptional regulator [Phototrophicales bacterium]
MSANYIDQILDLIRAKGIIRPRDLTEHGIARQYLQILCEQGIIERIGRGLYAFPNRHHEHMALIEVAQRAPNAVISLLSALQFHRLTTQLPFEVWLSIEGTSWKPQINYPPIHVVRFSGDAFHYGIETHILHGVSVKIYGVAKTIADCFKFRNKIGLDVALEALQQAIREKRVTIDEIWSASKVCRVHNVIRPYLQVIA